MASDVPDIDQTRGDLLPEGEVQFTLDREHDGFDICNEFSGWIFRYGASGIEEGAPVPPLHPNCRCYYVDIATHLTIKFKGSEWE